MISRSASSLLARCAVLSMAAMSGLVVRLKSEVMRRRRSPADSGSPEVRLKVALLLLSERTLTSAM